jgi:lipoyl(octanoyl) transferase
VTSAETKSPLLFKELGRVAYEDAIEAMRLFTDHRQARTPDELWLLEHDAVFTQGQAGKAEHVLDARGIPIIQADRGGQVTYHGPGQVVVYCLLDLRRRSLGVRQLVSSIENAIIRLLRDDFELDAMADPKAPGVYIEGRKIAALGLRVRRGCSYHGLSLNIDTDLTPFSLINPCGYAGLTVTSLEQERPDFRLDMWQLGRDVMRYLECELEGLPS